MYKIGAPHELNETKADFRRRFSSAVDNNGQFFWWREYAWGTSKSKTKQGPNVRRKYSEEVRIWTDMDR
jgi:hypothetical protein